MKAQKGNRKEILIAILVTFLPFICGAVSSKFFALPEYKIERVLAFEKIEENHDNFSEKTNEYVKSIYDELKGKKNEEEIENANNDGKVAEKTEQTQIFPNVDVSEKSLNDVMSGISIAEAENVSYKRSDYGVGWDVGTGCNIRSRILSANSTIEIKTSNGCTVIYGSWIDPYSGQTLTGNPYRGDGTSNDLDIDHVIPLAYVNAHGGYYWSSEKKISYGKSLEGMNNGVYLAVSASENREKGANGPSGYYPKNPNFYCEYSRKWRDIARIYGISLAKTDYEIIEKVLVECKIN